MSGTGVPPPLVPGNSSFVACDEESPGENPRLRSHLMGKPRHEIKKKKGKKMDFRNLVLPVPGEGGTRKYRLRKPSTALSRNLRNLVLASNPRLSYSCAFTVM